MRNNNNNDNDDDVSYLTFLCTMVTFPIDKDIIYFIIYWYGRDLTCPTYELNSRFLLSMKMARELISSFYILHYLPILVSI